MSNHEVEEGKEKTLHIEMLPGELIGRILNEINNTERHRIIPLVSHHFCRINKSYPPSCKIVEVCEQGHPWTIKPFYHVLIHDEFLVQQFAGVVQTVRELRVLATLQADLPALLRAAALAPKLRKLQIHERVDWPILGSLALLSQLRHLYLGRLHLPKLWDPADLQCFTGLQSLEGLIMRLDVHPKLDPEQARGLWAALASLGRLRTLYLELCYYHPSAKRRPARIAFPHDSFFAAISLLSQLRCLSLDMDQELLDEHHRLNTALSGLTGLTSFSTNTPLEPAAFDPILDLTHLDDLEIALLEPSSDSPVGEPFQRLPPRLDSLSVNRGSFDLWLPAVPLGLKELSLCYSPLRSLPDLLSRRMPCLSRLSLLGSDCRHLPPQLAQFTYLRILVIRNNYNLQRLPPQLAQLTSLEVLDISFNSSLQLEESDLDILAALPHLRSLGAKCYKGHQSDWSDDSRRVIDSIPLRFPDLRVEIYQDYD